MAGADDRVEALAYVSWESRETRLLFAVLAVAWALGWLAFHVAGGLIHLLLVIAVVSLIVHFMRGRTAGT